MKTLIISLSILALALAGCWFWFRSSSPSVAPRTIQEVLTIPGGQDTMDAGNFLVDLLNEGDLPGVTRADHGVLETDEEVQDLKNPGVYPATRGFHFASKNGDLIHHYTVLLPRPRGAWQLQRAWDTDRAGQVVREYEVKAAVKP